MTLGGTLVVQSGKDVLGEANTLNILQPGNVLQDDNARTQSVRDTYNVFVEAILGVAGVTRSGDRVSLARGTR